MQRNDPWYQAAQLLDPITSTAGPQHLPAQRIELPITPVRFALPGNDVKGPAARQSRAFGDSVWLPDVDSV